MVRLLFVDNSFSTHLAWHELIECLPNAYYDMSGMSISDMVKLTLLQDPIFKIRCIPENQIYHGNGKKLKYTIFKPLSKHIEEDVDNKKWLYYSIMQPSTVFGKKYCKKGELSFLDIPLRQTQQVAIKKITNQFKGQILIVPVMSSVDTTDASKMKFKYLVNNSYRLNVYNNGSSKEERKIENDFNPQQRESIYFRPLSKRNHMQWNQYTERLLVPPSAYINLSITASPMDKNPRNLNETADNNKRNSSDALITKAPPMDTNLRNLNERADNKRNYSDALITRQQKIPRLSSAVKPSIKTESPKATEWSTMLDNVLERIRERQQKESNDDSNSKQPSTIPPLPKKSIYNVIHQQKDYPYISSSSTESEMDTFIAYHMNLLPKLPMNKYFERLKESSSTIESSSNAGNGDVSKETKQISTDGDREQSSELEGQSDATHVLDESTKRFERTLNALNEVVSKVNEIINLNQKTIVNNVDIAVQEMNDKMEEILAPDQSSASGIELECFNSMDTNFVELLKKYLDNRNLMDVSYIIECNVAKPFVTFEFSYFCSIKIIDKKLSDSFPDACSTPEQAMQIAAKNALKKIKKHDILSFTFFVSNLFLKK